MGWKSQVPPIESTLTGPNERTELTSRGNKVKRGDDRRRPVWFVISLPKRLPRELRGRTTGEETSVERLRGI
jgi:hypothetical protein